MRTPSRCAGLLAVPLLLAGCAGADAATEAPPAASAAASGPAPGDGPSETAAMVCGEDVVGDVSRALGLTSPPTTDSAWADPLFTCTQQLPVGPLVLTVEESPDRTAAAEHFTEQTADMPPTPGLGERAAAGPEGTVVVLKDAMTLTVDATGLPEVFGDDGQRRTDFAYEVASIVLGCWTGHE